MTIAGSARIGFPMPQIFVDGRVDGARVRSISQDAERLGYDSLWTQEQLMSRGAAASLEPIPLLAVAAGLTKRVKLGVSVYVMGRVEPLRLAKQLASLDQLSAGRVIAGVGAGTPDPAPGVEGMAKDRRLLRLSEGVELMRALWADEPADFEGRLWQVKGAMLPKPLQRPGIPIWFGANAESALQRAVRQGDGWMGAGSSSIDDFKRNVGIVRNYLAESGRDPSGFTLAKRQYVAIDDNAARAEGRLREWFGAYYGNADMASRVSVWGPAGIVQERLEEVADAGAETILVSPVFDYPEHLAAIAELTGLRA